MDPVSRQSYLKSIPSVEEVLRSDPFSGFREAVPRQALLAAIRTALARIRETILHSDDEDLAKIQRDRSGWIHWIREETGRILAPSLRPLINATGVIIHTNLGRSLLAEDALEAIHQVASKYSNLELDLAVGRRGSRYVHVEGTLCRLTGAEAAMVVNNNAGAVLISLNALAKDKEVIVSRGELVEIGGSFRMPDVMVQSGAQLVEVGTTNKTKLRDYEAAIGPQTALILKVHTSNYRILGFTQDVPLQDLVGLGQRYGIPVMKDLGSGCLVDLQGWGLQPEPMVQETLRTGVDLVTFSGDKLLGGPQAGLILGKGRWVERIRGNPLNRALRIDKLTLAALEATLRSYWDPAEAVRRIPTLRMLTMSDKSIRQRAQRLARKIRKAAPPGLQVLVTTDRSQAGGGSLPLMELPTWVVSLHKAGVSAAQLERLLRGASPPVIARIHKEEVRLDLRTVQDKEVPLLAGIVTEICLHPSRN